MGALTSKSNAYRTRPWELTNIETKVLTDPFFQTIAVGIRNTKILRVLPIIGINEWITDEIRNIKRIQNLPPSVKLQYVTNYKLHNQQVKTKAITRINLSKWETLAITNKIWSKDKNNIIILDEFTDIPTIDIIRKQNLESKCFSNIPYYKINNRSNNIDIEPETIIIEQNSKNNPAIKLALNQSMISNIYNISLKSCLSFIEGRYLPISNAKLITSTNMSFKRYDHIDQYIINGPNKNLNGIQTFKPLFNNINNPKILQITHSPNTTNNELINISTLSVKDNNTIINMHEPSFNLISQSYLDFSFNVIKNPQILQQKSIKKSLLYTIKKKKKNTTISKSLQRNFRFGSSPAYPQPWIPPLFLLASLSILGIRRRPRPLNLIQKR